jgi:hypothetical protein
MSKSTLVHPVHYQIQRTCLKFHPCARILGVYKNKDMNSPMKEAVPTKYLEKRRGRRAKMSRPLRVRPSEPRDEHFEDLPISVNASKDGIYFVTRLRAYYKGMRVFVTFPFNSPHDPMNCEYIAEVVRVEELPKDKFGVAVHLRMSVNYGS